MAAAKSGILMAAVESERGIVWVQLMTDRDDPNAFDAHETWSALLAWAGRLLDPFLRQHRKIGRAHVCNPVPNTQLVCRLQLEKNKLQTTLHMHTKHYSI